MSDIQVDAPVVVNDDGTGRTGTRVDAVSWYAAFLTAINNQVLSDTNPTLTPAEIIDEVVTARAAYADLDARLDDFALASSVTNVVTEAQFMGGLGGVNLVRDDDFLLWPDGDASAPLYWTLSGAGASVARIGTGLADTNRKVGDFAVKVTRGGANAALTQTLLSGTAFTRADFLKGKYIAFGMWVKTSIANIGRVAVSDGAGTTYSSYHTGGGSWEFLPVTRQIDNAGTSIAVAGRVDNSDGAVSFSGATAVLLDSDMDLAQYQPSQVVYGSMHFALSGNLVALANVGRVIPARGGIVKDVQVSVKTAPVGSSAIFDVNTWDGASLTSMFSTRPEIADGAFYGGAQPDTTYARRCLRGVSGATMLAGGLLSIDVDQIGSGTAGADGAVEVRILQYTSPLERFLEYNG